MFTPFYIYLPETKRHPSIIALHFPGGKDAQAQLTKRNTKLCRHTSNKRKWCWSHWRRPWPNPSTSTTLQVEPLIRHEALSPLPQGDHASHVVGSFSSFIVGFEAQKLQPVWTAEDIMQLILLILQLLALQWGYCRLHWVLQ